MSLDYFVTYVLGRPKDGPRTKDQGLRTKLRSSELLRRLEVLTERATTKQVMQRGPHVDDADQDQRIAK